MDMLRKKLKLMEFLLCFSIFIKKSLRVQNSGGKLKVYYRECGKKSQNNLFLEF